MRPPKYTNPKLPEGISSGHEHPLVDVAKSSAVVIALLAVLVVGSFFAARLAAPYLPFAWEKALAERATARALDRETGDTAAQAKLQDLADRVAAAMDLPEDMTITVHFLDGDAVNAFATLGGHIFVFDGLWQRLDSENTAAMLLGHEIAHVKNRDPIRSMSGALLASLAASAIIGDTRILGSLVGTGNLLTALHFSRAQETQADADAAAALVALYGHMAGAAELFFTLQDSAAARTDPPEFLASHPDLDARIGDLERLAASKGWQLQGETIPLP